MGFAVNNLIGFGVGGANEIIFTQSTNITTGGNVYTLMGSPAAAGAYRFIIATGVEIYSSGTGTPGLVTGTFPAGSTLTIENRGTIKGRGGGGGSGSVTIGLSGGGGSSGGDAIRLDMNASIDNGAGNIWGGGGGGGGGGSAHHSWADNDFFGAGGAGGAGAGPSAATTGSGGGSATSGGGTSTGGSGGDGGDYGASGASGGSGSYGTTGGGGSGGAAGKAVNLNSKVVTWLAGNNPTQVKGAVS